MTTSKLIVVVATLLVGIKIVAALSEDLGASTLNESSVTNYKQEHARVKRQYSNYPYGYGRGYPRDTPIPIIIFGGAGLGGGFFGGGGRGFGGRGFGGRGFGGGRGGFGGGRGGFGGGRGGVGGGRGGGRG